MPESRWSRRSVGGPVLSALGGAVPAAVVVATLGATSPLPLVLLSLIALLTASAIYASLRFCGWYPTPRRDLERIRALAGLAPGQVFIDLGCGDGRVVAFLSRATGARCIGVELSLFHFALAWIRKVLSRARTMELRLGDLYSQDLREADVVYLYGIPPAMREERLRSLLATLREGARVICFHFGLEDRVAEAVDEPPGRWPLYLYRMRK